MLDLDHEQLHFFLVIIDYNASSLSEASIIFVLSICSELIRGSRFSVQKTVLLVPVNWSSS